MEECLERRGDKVGLCSPRHLVSSAQIPVITVILMISHILPPFYDLSRSESRNTTKEVYINSARIVFHERVQDASRLLSMEAASAREPEMHLQGLFKSARGF